MSFRALLAAALVLPAGLLFGLAPPVGQAQSADAALPTLQQAFDNVGITVASDTATGNFDGVGDSFSATGLAADALAPGKPLLHDGLAITWPDVRPGQPDNVVAGGQTVAVSGTGTTLGVIGASAFGSTTGMFTVSYADGTTSTATVTFADWIDSSPAAGTDLLATTAGWNPGGTIPVSLSYAAIPLSGDPVSVTLPTVSTGVGKNVPSMHIFGLIIGTPGQEAAGAPGAPSRYSSR